MLARREADLTDYGQWVASDGSREQAWCETAGVGLSAVEAWLTQRADVLDVDTIVRVVLTLGEWPVRSVPPLSGPVRELAG